MVAMDQNIVVAVDPTKGNVYVYRHVAIGDDNYQWVQDRASPISLGTAFEISSIDIHDEVIAIGRATSSGGGPSGSGEVYIYRFKPDGATGWYQEQVITRLSGAGGNGQSAGAGISSNDNFGQSVALYSNTLVVGTPGMTSNTKSNAGTAYVYRHDPTRIGTSGRWQFEKLLEPAVDDDSVNYAGAFAGKSVSIHGPYIAIGAPDYNTNDGRVTLYRQYGGDWHFADKVPAPQSDILFGTDVNLWNQSMVIGAPKFNSFQGAIYEYHYNGTHWDMMNQFSRSADYNGGEYFGRSVGLSGGTVIIGEPYYDNAGGGSITGAFHFQEINKKSAVLELGADTANIFSQYGHKASMVGDIVNISTGSAGGNKNFFISYNGSSWSTENFITLPSTVQSIEQASGHSIVASGSTGDYLVSGYYRNLGNLWEKTNSIDFPDPGTNSGFGKNTSILGNSVAISDDYEVFLYNFNGTEWVHVFTVTPGPGITFDDDILLSENKLFIASNTDDNIYVYHSDCSDNGLACTWSKYDPLAIPFSSSASSKFKISYDQGLILVGEVANNKFTTFSLNENVWLDSSEIISSGFGKTVAIKGDRLLTSSSSTYVSVYYFDRNGTWVPEGILDSSLDGSNSYGDTIILDMDSIFITAKTAVDNGLGNAGMCEIRDPRTP